MAVLHCFHFDFLNYTTGRLDPSYEGIARMTGLARSTVAAAIARLKRLGIINWVRRCAKTYEGGVFTLRQETNAYAVLPPSHWTQFSPDAFAGTVMEKWDEKQFVQFGIENQNWMLSQFMHGEQGALLCTAKIVETVPWIDAKYYAATQVMDEARHVEVFSKYLDTKLSGHYPMNGHLGMLLDDIVSDSRWDMTYLGMQIMVEGLALAAFGFIHMMTTEPLLKKLLRYVMADEARHVAFGVLSLQEYYKELNAAELRERQEFAFEAAIRMKDRLVMQEVWERMEVPIPDVIKIMNAAPERDDFQILLFSKIVPNLRKLGLLDAADGWLRTKFTEMGAIAFEHLRTPPRTRTPSPTARRRPPGRLDRRPRGPPGGGGATGSVNR